MKTRRKRARRRMVAAASAAATVIGLALPSAAQAQVDQRVYVPSWTQSKALVYDAQASLFDDRVDVTGEPYDAAITPDGRFAFVTQRAANTFSVLSVATGGLLAIVPTGPLPRDVVITPDGKRAYITESSANLVAVFDVATLTQVASIPTGVMPWGIAITPDGTKALVVNRMDNTVGVIDTNTLAVTALFNVDSQPVEVAISPDGRIAYVTSTLGNVVDRIDLQQMESLPAIAVGKFPRSLAVTPDNRMVVVACSDDNTIAFIDVPTSTVTSMPVGLNALPSGVAISADGRTAYVGEQGTFFNNEWISLLLVIDLPTRTITASKTFDVDGQALRVAISPDIIGWPGILPNAVLTAGSDADLTHGGFAHFVPFNSGTLRVTSTFTTTRAVSLMQQGGTIDTQTFNLELDGGIVGDGPLTKMGFGYLKIRGMASHPLTVVQQGTLLLLNAFLTGDIQMTGPGDLLLGNATVRDLTITQYGSINPGVGGIGTLRVRNLTMTGLSNLVVDIQPGVGAGCDQVLVSGTAALNGGALEVNAANVTVTPGSAFTIVTNATGTFANLPEGAVVTPFAGTAHFHITYLGGAGHDVVLTAF